MRPSPFAGFERYSDVDSQVRLEGGRDTGRRFKRCHEALVRWAGFDSSFDSWEPEDDIHPGLIKDYMSARLVELLASRAIASPVLLGTAIATMA